MIPRQLFIEDPGSGRIRLTRAGIERYGPRLVRMGWIACKTATRAEMEAATDASFMHELASEAEGANPESDRTLVGLLPPDHYSSR